MTRSLFSHLATLIATIVGLGVCWMTPFEEISNVAIVITLLIPYFVLGLNQALLWTGLLMLVGFLGLFSPSEEHVLPQVVALGVTSLLIIWQPIRDIPPCSASKKCALTFVAALSFLGSHHIVEIVIEGTTKPVDITHALVVGGFSVFTVLLGLILLRGLRQIIHPTPQEPAIAW